MVRRGRIGRDARAYIVTTTPAVGVEGRLRPLHVALDNVARSVQRTVGRRGQDAPRQAALYRDAVRAVRNALSLRVVEGVSVRHA